MDKVKELENTFNHGISIAERKNIIVTGVKKIENFPVNFIADEESFGRSFSLTSTSLTDESLRIALLALAPVENTQTLTIGSTNLARLSPEQIKVATDKNWTVV